MSRQQHPPGEVADAGLQSERTYLAWQRTGLAFAASGALLVHVAGGLRHPLGVLPGLFGLLASAVIFAGALVRYRSTVAAALGRGAAASPAALSAAALAASVLSVTGLLVVLLAP